MPDAGAARAGLRRRGRRRGAGGDSITCRLFTLDALGRTVAETDANGHETRFSHDASGRLVAVTDALGQVTRYGFDDRGNMTSQQDALGRVTRYAFDEAGRRVSRTLPLLQSERLAHGLDGALLSRTSFGGAVTTRARGFDGNQRQDSIDLPGGSAADITTTTWGDGQRHVVSDASGTTTYQRDLATGRLTGVVRADSTITHTHDASGNVASITTSVPGGASHVVTRTHDAGGRLASVADSGGSAEYAYSASGQIETVSYLQPGATAPFVTGTYVQDPLTGGVQSITWKDAIGATLRSFTYALDQMGRRVEATETGVDGTRVVTWESDDLYRLIGESVTEADLSTWDPDNHAYFASHYYHGSR